MLIFPTIFHLYLYLLSKKLKYGGYQCICPYPYVGVNCATNSACDINPCFNSGVCQTTSSSPFFKCLCKSGFSGSRCELSQGQCNATACQNGFCNSSSDLSTLSACSCFYGWAGNSCDQRVDGCASSPCANGATCIADTQSGSYSCLCKQGYTGANCEIFINMCKAGFCLNGGLCSQSGATAVCNCLPGYTGKIFYLTEMANGFDFSVCLLSFLAFKRSYRAFPRFF